MGTKTRTLLNYTAIEDNKPCDKYYHCEAKTVKFGAGLF